MAAVRLEACDERVPFLLERRDRVPLELLEPDPPERLVPDEPVVPPSLVESDLFAETPGLFEPAETLTETDGVPDTGTFTFTAPDTGAMIALAARVGTRTGTVGTRTGTVGTRTGTVGTATVGTRTVGTTTVGRVGSGSCNLKEGASPAPVATPADARAAPMAILPSPKQTVNERILMRRIALLRSASPLKTLNPIPRRIGFTSG